MGVRDSWGADFPASFDHSDLVAKLHTQPFQVLLRLVLGYYVSVSLNI